MQSAETATGMDEGGAARAKREDVRGVREDRGESGPLSSGSSEDGERGDAGGGRGRRERGERAIGVRVQDARVRGAGGEGEGDASRVAVQRGSRRVRRAREGGARARGGDGSGYFGLRLLTTRGYERAMESAGRMDSAGRVAEPRWCYNASNRCPMYSNLQPSVIVSFNTPPTRANFNTKEGAAATCARTFSPRARTRRATCAGCDANAPSCLRSPRACRRGAAGAHRARALRCAAQNWLKASR